MRALLICLLLAGCASTPYGKCREQAYARDAHPFLGIGTLIAEGLDPAPPHPPLDAMLAACEALK